MLRPKVISQRQASTYYEKDDYYIRKDMANEWQGKLAEELGLKGAVDKADYDMLIANRKERAGIDLCFSAPKSVSIAMALDENTKKELTEAHDRAVEATLKEIEKEAVGCRVVLEKGGPQVYVKTGNAVFMKSSHDVSREQDPLKHTHAVLLNQTEYNGKFYAIEARPIFQTQMYYGQVYRSKLAEQLLQKGYEIERTEKGSFELKGVSREMIDHFSKRRAQIEEKAREMGDNSGAARDYAAISTRKAKEKITDYPALVQEWKNQIQELGGVELVRSEKAIERTNLEKDLAFDEGVKRLARQEYAFKEKDLIRSVMAANIANGVTEAEAKEMIANSPDLIRAGERLDMPGGHVYYTTRENLAQEARIIEIAEGGRGSMPGIGKERAEELLKKFDPENTLAGQQGDAVRQMVCSDDRVFGLQGLAGTGKTYALKYAREVWEAEGYTVRGGAFAGKAAAGLEEDSGIKSGTIHKLLNQLEKEAGNQNPAQDLEIKNSWLLQGLKPGEKKEVWIIDEAGMVNNNLMAQLLEAAKAKDAKVILTGDDRQLPPIGAGNAFGDLVQTDKIDHCIIDNIRRQKDSPELLQNVRESVIGDVGKAFDNLPVQEIGKNAARLKEIVKEYTSGDPEKQAGTLILTADNASRRELNRRIREELQKKGQLGKGQEYSVVDGTGRKMQREFVQGDKIIFLKNDDKLDIKNGQTGTIKGIDGDKLTIEQGKKEVVIDLKKFNAVDHGYARTSYKSQGETVERVLVNIDSKMGHMNDRNQFYVDISRAKLEAKLYVDDKAKVREQVQEFAHKLTSRDFAPIEKSQETQAKEVFLGLEAEKQKIRQGVRELAAEQPGPGSKQPPEKEKAAALDVEFKKKQPEKEITAGPDHGRQGQQGPGFAEAFKMANPYKLESLLPENQKAPAPQQQREQPSGPPRIKPYLEDPGGKPVRKPDLRTRTLADIGKEMKGLERPKVLTPLEQMKAAAAEKARTIEKARQPEIAKAPPQQEIKKEKTIKGPSLER